MLSWNKTYATVYIFYHLSYTEPSILSAIANISRSDHVDSSSNTRIVHTGYHLGGFLISDVHSNCQIYRFSAFFQPGEDLLEASNMGVDGHRFATNVHLLLHKAITLPLFIFILIDYWIFLIIWWELRLETNSNKQEYHDLDLSRYVWKVGTTNIWPCFGRPKLGECEK